MTEFIGALFDISIHALLAESDLPVFLSGFWAYLFLSTLSLRRATRLFLEIYTLFKNFYPRSPCGERLLMWWQSNTTIKISIHALLAESDHFATLKFVNPYISIHALLAESDNIPLPNAHVISISIHALLAESDGIQPQRAVLMPPFLSTLSLRRATVSSRSVPSSCRHFYPRSPCGERLILGLFCLSA